ncbi:dUTP diphosphatase [Salinispora mooreana]|uniref:dUTP diphosphatase n=1 Tax=Salinispora mooreana TaxID=999545 RepID=UPI00037BED60|nr:dUTP diphosphatase [Salinispora mooreana]
MEEATVTDVVPVPVRQLDPGLPLPAYAHPGDAGADLVAAADVELPPGGRALVPTGVAIALPEGYVGLVHPRSGLAARLGVTVLNAPGTVDAGYRGEILVNLINHDREAVARIARGDRIAQLVVQRVARARFQPAAELPASQRGAGGHGSTGGHAGLGSAPATDGRQPVPEVS